jgi:hypothetical protein
MLLISLYMQFSFVSVIPKYFNFPMFSKNMLAVFMLWFCHLLEKYFQNLWVFFQAILLKCDGYVTENTAVNKTQLLRGNSELRESDPS